MNDKVKIMDRLRKIMKLAEGSNHQGEIENALRMARKLCAEHKIDISELEADENAGMGSFTLKTGASVWKRSIASIIGSFFGLAGAWNPAAKEVVFFGEEALLEPTEFCIGLATADVLHKSKSVLSRSKNDYRLSMVSGLSSVLVEIQKVESDVTAIVVQKQAKAKDYMASQIQTEKRKPRKKRFVLHEKGVRQGKELGNKIKNNNKYIN